MKYKINKSQLTSLINESTLLREYVYIYDKGQHAPRVGDKLVNITCELPANPTVGTHGDGYWWAAISPIVGHIPGEILDQPNYFRIKDEASMEILKELGRGHILTNQDLYLFY